MALQHDLAWQASLFDTGEIEYDQAVTGCRRRHLTEGAWVDHLPGWVGGADELFARLLQSTPWALHERWMYDRKVTEPRLTHRWYLDGESEQAPPSVLVGMAAALSSHYGVAFTQVGVNLYRDGSDSVAWHGDRVAREIPQATVALVSLGAPRPFKLRPKGGGGRSLTYLPGPGDLLVMGGSCQRTWDHAVPKIAAAGPRISIQFRHVYPRAAVPGRNPVET